MAHRPDCHELEDVVKTEVQARPWCRKPTDYRDAFQREPCHTWKRMSCQTPVISRDPAAQQ